jgi:hypothetical protein
MVKVSLREDGDDIELPTYYTKRSLYKQLGADCKWELASSSTGNISKKKLDGCTVEQLPSWRTFTRFWKRYYPHVHISKPNEDICEDCHKFVNYYRTAKAKSDSNKKRKASVLNDEVGDTDSEDEDEDEDEDDEADAGGSTSTPTMATDDEGEC